GIGMNFRYRMEFFPFLEFSAFIGFYAICIRPDRFSMSYRKRLSLILIASAGFGIVYSHFLLFLYKISNFGDYAHPGADTRPVSPAEGWLGYYNAQLHAVFPSIAKKLRW